MKPEHHVTASALVSGILYAVTHDTRLAVSAAFSGVFLDLDHIPDYLVQHDGPKSISGFFQACNQNRIGKTYLVLHAWEWLVITGLTLALAGSSDISVGLFLGFLHHMLLDQIGNHPHPYGYWFSWRIARGFERDSVFPRCLSR